MKRYEVRGDHPATATWGTSGRVTREQVFVAARTLFQEGHVGLVVIDHDTGDELTVEDFLRPGETLA